MFDVFNFDVGTDVSDSLFQIIIPSSDLIFVVSSIVKWEHIKLITFF